MKQQQQELLMACCVRICCGTYWKTTVGKGCPIIRLLLTQHMRMRMLILILSTISNQQQQARTAAV